MDKDGKTQAESERQRIRREQVGQKESPIYANSYGGIIKESRKPKHFSERVPGTDREGQNPFGSVNRQVVQRLILQSSGRLQEARDHIAFYENVIDQLTQEIEELEQLSQLMEDQEASEEE